MKSLISFIAWALVLNKTYGAPIQANGIGSPYLLNNLAVNNLVPVGLPSAPVFTASYMPNNYANAIPEPIAKTNVVSTLASDLLNSVASNSVASTNFLPNNLANLEVTKVQFTPVLSELMPSLQFGDITVAGDLPIGGTIKVCGCIPVYGMISVDGIVPTAGTAVVADAIENRIADLPCNCPNQIFS